MGLYTRITRSWLEHRFQRRSPAGVFYAHMPVYGYGQPDCETGHTGRLARGLLSHEARVAGGRELVDQPARAADQVREIERPALGLGLAIGLGIGAGHGQDLDRGLGDPR
jgi:hypothetical protein